MKILLLGLLLVAPSAFARSSRNGPNFGLQARAINETDSQKLADGTDTHQLETVTLSPFVGYVVSTYFNLGVSLTSENTTITDTHSQSGQETTSVTDSQLRGASVFVRLLFARYMFLEAGLGVYEGSSKITQSTRTGESSFSGNATSTSHSGTGYGHHTGAGIEIPVGLGWYVSTAVYHREVKLNELISATSSNQLSNHKTELEFGLTQYLQ